MKPSKKRTLRLGLIQTAASADPSVNSAAYAALVRRAAKKGAKIICLPELYRSRYFPQTGRAKVAHLAETVPGESSRLFAGLARELKVVLIVPIFEKGDDGRYYNSAVVIDADGSLFPVYRKMHIPQDPHFYEKNYFRPGDRGFKVFKTRYAAISVLICYDQWFPEAARISTLAGAEILFYPTAIGFMKGDTMPEGDWREAWVTIQRSHAIANGIHVAAVNRTGTEGSLRFWGTSFVSDSFGTVTARAGDKEQVLIADVDLSRNRLVRDGWGFLRNRRPESYAALTGRKR